MRAYFMQKIIFQVKAWIQYKIKAHGRHGIHSPFVYELYDQVICPDEKNNSDDLLRLYQLKKILEKDRRLLEIVDFGAGMQGQVKEKSYKTVARLAKNSARGPKFGALLYRLCRWLQPQTILEMGTNLGVSTLYQMLASPESRMITMEGCPAIADIARENFKDFKLNPEVRVGEFSNLLNQMEWSESKPDYCFIDGNHRKEPTLEYFHLLMQHTNPQTVFIFDDIHWSPGMEEAWNIICSDSRVQISIDLYGMGICFTGKNQAKEHFILNF